MTNGMMVTINFGPFAGLSGIVVSTSGERTTVRIILKGRAVLVDLETDMIRAPVTQRTQHPRRRNRLV
jgi:transcription antitermination factor NusG